MLYNGEIYLVAGITNGHHDGHVAWTDAFNPRTGQWRQLPDAPRPRDHFHAAIIDNKIHAAAGRRSSAATGQTFQLTVPDVDVFNLETKQWTTLPAASHIPTQRAGAGAVVMNGKLIVLGGESGQPLAHDSVEELDPVTADDGRRCSRCRWAGMRRRRSCTTAESTSRQAHGRAAQPRWTRRRSIRLHLCAEGGCWHGASRKMRDIDAFRSRGPLWTRPLLIDVRRAAIRKPPFPSRGASFTALDSFRCGGEAHAKTSGCQWSAGSTRGNSFGRASRASFRSSSASKAIGASSRHWRRDGTNTTTTPSTTPKAAAAPSRNGIGCATSCGSISSAIRVTDGTRPMPLLMPPHSDR